MRKTLFTLVTLALFVGQIIASPIDVDRAQRIGMKYLQSNYAKQVGTLSLAYTQMTESGQPALYVFNGDNSFVIVSADDAALPILGASDEHSFDYNDLPDGLAYMLRHYARQIQYAKENNRTVHHGNIPRIGGVAIFLAFIGCSLYLIRDIQNFKGLLIGAGIIFVFGLGTLSLYHRSIWLNDN